MIDLYEKIKQMIIHAIQEIILGDEDIHNLSKEFIDDIFE